MTDTQAESQTSPIVYVRPVAATELKAEAAQQNIELDDSAVLYAVHTEDGIRRAVFSDRSAAFAAAEDYGAQPVSVH